MGEQFFGTALLVELTRTSLMKMSRHPVPSLLISSLMAAILSGCAAMVPSQPARLAPLSSQSVPAALSITRDVEIKLSTGYSRTVPAGSRWRAVGLLPQGVVFQRSDDVFTIEGHDVHEAYLVVKGSTLQGFYLAGESSFSPLVPHVSLPLGAP